MTNDDFNLLLKVIGRINKSLPEKTYTRKEVKILLLQVEKEMENETNG